MRLKQKKITIINTVPVNGGDEALLRATILGLEKYFNDPIVHVLCNNPILYQKHIDFVKLDWDWEYAFKRSDSEFNLLPFKVKLKMRVFLKKIVKIPYHSKYSRMLSSNREKRVYNILNNSDLVLLGAGGYIHDFYSYEKRLKTIMFIRDVIKKPYYIFSQSIGPFWDKKKFQRLNDIFLGAEKIILRESYSLNHLKSIGYNGKNILVSNDIAFYLYFKYSKKVDTAKFLKKIAINFREWEFENESEPTFLKAVKLCESLIGKGYELTFVSTCQGIKGYKDDSKLAVKIVGSLNSEQKKRCTILTDKYSFDGFLQILTQQDAYIGMRLHGAILSLIAGVPALNIAYEDKGLGIYNTLGLTDYCFSYKEDFEVWMLKTNNLIENYEHYLNNLGSITEKAARSVEQNFEILLT